VGTDEGEYEAPYVVLATGADRSIAEDLGCETTDDGVVDVDVTMETSVPNAYATGAMVRAEEWQAVISAGDGAAAGSTSSPRKEASTSTTSTCPPTPSNRSGRRPPTTTGGNHRNRWSTTIGKRLPARVQREPMTGPKRTTHRTDGEDHARGAVRGSAIP
jgi:hypothetical protein